MSRRTSLLIIGLVILILVVALAIMLPQWRAATPAAPATNYPAPVATVAPTPTQEAPPPTAAPATATAGAVSQASPLAAPPAPASLRRYTYRVVNVFPHDPAAWTQGLVYADGVFYVGTGLTGQSSLRKVEPATGAVLQQHNLEEQYFGEGIALFGDKIYQLTWKNNFGFIYDKDTFAELGRFAYPTEGWGITHDGSQLIMSDGTPNLYFLDAQTLTETHRIAVTYQGQPLGRLNELEYFDGAIWANVWYTDALVRIDPATGVVTGVVDLRGLLSAAPPSATPADILNGIAYDETTGRIFVTGKFWPAVFEIELVEVTQ
jgi:glutamine cyclotransferase